MQKITCCKDCSERRIGCHGMCKDYMEEVNKNKQWKENVKKNKTLDDAFIDLKKQAQRNMQNIKSPNGILVMHKK